MTPDRLTTAWIHAPSGASAVSTAINNTITMTRDYEILTHRGTVSVDADRYRIDDEGDIYLYVEGEDDPVACVSEAEFVAIYDPFYGEFAEPT